MASSVANADGTYKMDRGATDTNNALKAYLEKEYNYKPQFMFINCIEAHENYPIRDSSIIQDKWLYLSGILEMSEDITKKFHEGYRKRLSYLDKQIGKSLQILRDNGMLDDASVIATSDHGQFFGEHGMLYHSLYPYNEVNNVPLSISKFENGKPVSNPISISDPTSLIDLHGMILSMAGSKESYKRNPVISEHNGISEGWDGMLLSALRRRSEYAARIYKTKLSYNSRAYSIISDGYKLVDFYGKRPSELYRIGDKEEKENVIDSNKSIAKRLSLIYKYSKSAL